MVSSRFFLYFVPSFLGLSSGERERNRRFFERKNVDETWCEGCFLWQFGGSENVSLDGIGWRSGFLRSAVHDVNRSGRDDEFVGWDWGRCPRRSSPTLRKGAKDGHPAIRRRVQVRSPLALALHHVKRAEVPRGARPGVSVTAYHIRKCSSRSLVHAHRSGGSPLADHAERVGQQRSLPVRLNFRYV